MVTTRTEYDQRHFDDNYPVGFENNFWPIARNRLILNEFRIASQSGRIGASARLLEVGCGPGVVLKSLIEHGWDAWGVELGRPAVLPGIQDRTFCGSDATQLPEEFRNSIDVLLLFDVLEHIPNDIEFLSSLLGAFPRCSFVGLTVPARPEVWSAWDTHYGHFRRYLPDTLDDVLRSAGLKIVRQRYFFHSLYLAAMGLNLLGRERVVVSSAPRHPALHRFIASILNVEHKIFSVLSAPGLSLFASAVPFKRPSR